MKTEIKIRKTKEKVVFSIPIDVFEKLFPAYPVEMQKPIEDKLDETMAQAVAEKIDSLDANPVKVFEKVFENVITPETTASNQLETPSGTEGNPAVQQ